MTAHVDLERGDSLDLTLYPEDGEVRIWGTNGSKESPIAIVRTPRPFHLRTACDRPHRDPMALSPRLWFLLGLSVGFIGLSFVLAMLR